MPDEALYRAGVKKMMSARELAHFLGVHQNYVYDQAVNGDLPSYKFGGVRRFRMRDIEEWLEKHRRKASSFAFGYISLNFMGVYPILDGVPSLWRAFFG